LTILARLDYQGRVILQPTMDRISECVVAGDRHEAERAVALVRSLLPGRGGRLARDDHPLRPLILLRDSEA
jgi:hypothetical protein